MPDVTPKAPFPKDYLGDGVYAEDDGYHIWLSTLEGHRIALEPAVLAALDRYRERRLAHYGIEG